MFQTPYGSHRNRGHNFSASTNVLAPLQTGRRAGVVGKFSTSGSVFATLGWVTNLGGAHQRTVTGDAGMRWVW
jgi:hypothetical protein